MPRGAAVRSDDDRGAVGGRQRGGLLQGREDPLAERVDVFDAGVRDRLAPAPARIALRPPLGDLGERQPLPVAEAS